MLKIDQETAYRLYVGDVFDYVKHILHWERVVNERIKAFVEGYA